MNGIIASIAEFWNRIPEMIVELFLLVWDNLIVAINWMWTELLGYGDQLISPGWHINELQAAMVYIDAITYLFPVYQTLGMVSAVYSVILSIRATRWLLACIPTLSLG